MPINEGVKIGIIIPVFNDWDCLELLLSQISRELGNNICASVFIVNDCSTEDKPMPDTISSKFDNLFIINLSRNIGHQKAIAIGLCYVADHHECDAVIVMDADGEDKPEDLKVLIDAYLEDKNKIVFATRNKRQEKTHFILLYFIYKFIFSLLVGKNISFGNFCIIPFKILSKLVHVSEIWNHFSGGIIRSKLLYTSVPINRGKRLIGESKMNLISLIIHGISSYTVHLDIVVVRMLILSGLIILAAILSGIVVSSLRFFTDLAIPGWATYTVLGFGIIILLAFFIIVNLALTTLYYRTQRLFIPALHYKDYILNVDKA